MSVGNVAWACQDCDGLVPDDELILLPTDPVICRDCRSDRVQRAATNERVGV